MAALALIGGTALRAYGDIMRGQEESRSAQFEQQQLQIQEQSYRTAAAQREAQRRRDLTSAFETIQAIRAGRGVGAGSPTGMAILENVIDTVERDISIEKANLLERADTARRASILAGNRASTSLLSGYLGGASDVATGVFQYSRIYPDRGSGRSLGNSSIGNPNRIGALY